MIKEINNLVMKNITDEKIEYVDVVWTPYTLFLYLLYQPLNKIMKTAFFCGTGLPQSICDTLPNSINWRHTDNSISRGIAYYIYNYKSHHDLINKYPFIKKSQIFGGDHLPQYFPIIQGHKITVIEDGLGLYHPLMARLTWKQSLMHKILGIPTKTYGRGNNCNRIIYTGSEPLSIKGKQLIKINPFQLWNEDDEKRTYIKEIFNIEQSDIKRFQGKDVILLTQPLYLSNIMTEEETMLLYKRNIEKYENAKVIIKLHPSESIDLYKKYFPTYDIIDKPIPFEILCYMGIEIKTAITYNSTSMYCIPNIENKVILKPSI
jgi:hypothetical protein